VQRTANVNCAKETKFQAVFSCLNVQKSGPKLKTRKKLRKEDTGDHKKERERERRKKAEKGNAIVSNEVNTGWTE
jgi:hypothetical protein